MSPVYKTCISINIVSLTNLQVKYMSNICNKVHTVHTLTYILNKDKSFYENISQGFDKVFNL